MTFLYKSSGEFEELRNEINQPDEHQKQEKFCRADKLALLITNSVYDEQQMGMKSLPDVKDDHKNMEHTIENMLDIPKENVFKVQEATFDKLEEVSKIVKVNI